MKAQRGYMTSRETNTTRTWRRSSSGWASYPRRVPAGGEFFSIPKKFVATSTGLTKIGLIESCIAMNFGSRGGGNPKGSVPSTAPRCRCDWRDRQKTIRGWRDWGITMIASPGSRRSEQFKNARSVWLKACSDRQSTCRPAFSRPRRRFESAAGFFVPRRMFSARKLGEVNSAIGTAS